MFIPELLDSRITKPNASVRPQTAPGSKFPPAEDVLKQLDKLHTTLAEQFEAFGVVGFGLGAGIISLCSLTSSRFKAAIQVYPYQLDTNVSSKVKVPTCILTSKDTDKESLQLFDDALQVPKIIDSSASAFDSALLSQYGYGDEKVLEAQRLGYTAMMNFLHDHL